MKVEIKPGKGKGTMVAPPSKSMAHRLLIGGGLSKGTSVIEGISSSEDMKATLDCLSAIGAKYSIDGDKVTITGADIRNIPKGAVLRCRESGSTLRFFIPICLLDGKTFTLTGSEKLLSRPLSVYEDIFKKQGITFEAAPDTITVGGKLKSGTFKIKGNISSQFITGLLLAAALIPGQSRIRLTGKVESRPYITMTQRAMERFGLPCYDFCITGGTPFHSPGTLTVEGDWSNGAFFLAAKALGNGVETINLSPDSPQGDRAVSTLLPALESHATISAADIPDLVPILSVAAASKQGAVFTDIQRLRLKESDRVASVIAMLEALGGNAEATEEALTVYGTGLTGGMVDSVNDHRIAMSAAIAATVCTEPVTILGAQCVKKSYPHFWEEYSRLGGHYEQYLR